MKNKEPLAFILLLFYLNVVLVYDQVNGKIVGSPNLNWSKEKWKSVLDDVTSKKQSTPEYISKILDVTKYATIKDNEYFEIDTICEVANSLDKFHADVIRVNSTTAKNGSLTDPQIKDCVTAISNMLDLDVTDLFEAQKMCNSTNKLIAFLNNVMYTHATKRLAISTPNIFAQVTTINPNLSNVILTYPSTKSLKVYENQANFDFVQTADNVEMALRIPPNATNNVIVIATFNNNNTFIHRGLQRIVDSVERHVGVYFENSHKANASAQNQILVRLKLSGKLSCYKSCVKYNHLSEEFDDQFCLRKEQKYLTCSFKPTTTRVSVSFIQNAIECVSYNYVLNPVNIVQTILAVAGYIYYFVRDRIQKCRAKEPDKDKCKSERIFYVLYQLTAVTFVKYFFMFVFDVRFFEMYYTPTYSCVIVAILSHFVLLAEFYFMFLFTVFLSSYFNVANYYIRRKTLVTASLLTWISPSVPIVVSELLFFITGVRFYDRRICFPTLDNFYYVTSVFVIPFALIALFKFIRSVSANTANLQHKNLKYLVIMVILLLFSILLTWICFVGMIFSSRVFFTLFCIVGILQCVFLCLLTCFCRCITLEARKEYDVVYKADANGDEQIVEEQNNFLK